MFARHALHSVRILVSCAPELRSRYPSSKLPWLYEGQDSQVKLLGMLHLEKCLSVLAVSERLRQVYCSTVVSHNGRDTPCCTTYGYDMVAALVNSTSPNVLPNRLPFMRSLHTTWLCIGAPRVSRNCTSRGMSDRPSSQRVSAFNTHFLERLQLCREYVPQCSMAQMPITCITRHDGK